MNQLFSTWLCKEPSYCIKVVLQFPFTLMLVFELKFPFIYLN